VGVNISQLLACAMPLAVPPLSTRALFAFFQEGGVELLAEAADQGCGLARTGRAKNQQALVEGKAENLVLVLIENGLIPQPHLGDDAAAHAVDDVGLDGFFGQQLPRGLR
jgi:hypothetical protein